MRKFLLAFAPLVLLLFLVSCGGNHMEVAEEDTVIPEAPEEPVSEMADFKFHTLVANIPSPLVTYDILESSGAPYAKDLSNPLENRNKYQIESTKAMNFGIYMADFGYALLNDDNQKALKYYAVAHALAKDLGFGSVLDEVVNERLISTIGNTDSAKVLLNEAYTAVDNYLESNDQLKSAGYIITGGWLQTQHLVLNLLGTADSEELISHLSQEVYVQQLHIGNLISFLIEYQSDPGVANIIEQLVSVKGAYDKLIDAKDVMGDKMEGLKTAIGTMRASIVS